MAALQSSPGLTFNRAGSEDSAFYFQGDFNARISTITINTMLFLLLSVSPSKFLSCLDDLLGLRDIFFSLEGTSLVG